MWKQNNQNVFLSSTCASCWIYVLSCHSYPHRMPIGNPSSSYTTLDTAVSGSYLCIGSLHSTFQPFLLHGHGLPKGPGVTLKKARPCPLWHSSRRNNHTKRTLPRKQELVGGDLRISSLSDIHQFTGPRKNSLIPNYAVSVAHSRAWSSWHLQMTVWHLVDSLDFLLMHSFLIIWFYAPVPLVPTRNPDCLYNSKHEKKPPFKMVDLFIF